MNKYKVDVPPGKSGPWKIERFTVSEQDESLERIRALGNRGRFCPAGTYTRLCHEEYGVVMSDTPDEIHDHMEPIYQAKGRCLINGLGLGVVLGAMASKPEVTSVMVVEIDMDVIRLIAGHYQQEPYGHKIRIFLGDALTWNPPRTLEKMRWNVVWHDIWNGICADNLPTMHRLHRKYGRHCDWQGSWARWRCERQRRENRGFQALLDALKRIPRSLDIEKHKPLIRRRDNGARV